MFGRICFRCISLDIFVWTYFLGRICWDVFPGMYFLGRICWDVFPWTYFLGRISLDVFFVIGPEFLDGISWP